MVIDTMVFAYALLRVENYHEQAIWALEIAEQIIVPDSLLAELGNVVWQWIQFQQLPIETGLKVLEDAEASIDQIVPTASVREMALQYQSCPVGKVRSTRSKLVNVKTQSRKVPSAHQALSRCSQRTYVILAVGFRSSTKLMVDYG